MIRKLTNVSVKIIHPSDVVKILARNTGENFFITIFFLQIKIIYMHDNAYDATKVSLTT